MRKSMLEAYERVKKIKAENCVEEAERLRKQGSEANLRMAIYLAEKYENELSGMLWMMESVGVITKGEADMETAELREQFSPVKLYGANVLHSTGLLMMQVSKIKKED